MKNLYQTWAIGGSGYAVIQDQQIVEARTTDLTDNYLWDSGEDILFDNEGEILLDE